MCITPHSLFQTLSNVLHWINVLLTPTSNTNSPYHVVADKPLTYEAQSKTPNSWRARRLPNIDVMDRTPPAVVTTATTGTCSAYKGRVIH